ncbi:Fe-only nitrogenase accessory AnfO family protein [Methanocella arvoryzae]|uniref:Uncharacterized protein n=1 Tax=Methanocella arvoryzae (strain DSM 22066 / NBRC 105507 / MRE50) TaxID=351160 RepID=Q0W435_METAR|nr:Fe-only nitrogenase accessory AnfO family protein [Methanocella arvoryzae]CAJ36858.1 conserved hypothetical protein [Methanocella arvoryzae MRE50]
MAREIAVFQNAEGVSASLGERGKVAVYRRAGGSWDVGREKEFSIGTVKGIRELRLGMSDMLQFLAGCKIFVARSAAGVPYFELEKAGCSVWEIAGRPEEFLDQVWENEESERSTPPEATFAIPVPAEISPGNYYISIKEIQEKNADISSKQVLQQFVRHGCYSSLVVVCSHVPPWMEAETTANGLTFETERLGRSEFMVRIARGPEGRR